MNWTSLVCVLALVACSSKPADEGGPGSAAGSESAVLLTRNIPPDVTRVQTAVGATLAGFSGLQLIVAAVPTGIVLAGKTIVPIVNGAIDPAEKENGPMGVGIPRLSETLRALAQIQQQLASVGGTLPPDDLIQLAIDPRVTYDVFHLAFVSARRAGLRAAVLLRSDGELRALLVGNAVEGDIRSMGVRVSAGEVVVSTTGGPDRRIALDSAAPMELSKELASIPAGALGLSVVFACAPGTSMQVVAELLVAMHPHATVHLAAE